MVFWTDIIKRFVKTIVFAPGWQYSKGAMIEFLSAQCQGIPRLNLDLTTLYNYQMISSLELAIDFLKSANIPTEYQENALRIIKNETQSNMSKV